MPSLKRSRIMSSSSVNENFHIRTKVLNEILDKCKTLVRRKDWGTLTKMKLIVVEKLCLSKVRIIPLTKYNLLKKHHYVHTIRKLDILNLDTTLGF